jgi:hypothetical protein
VALAAAGYEAYTLGLVDESKVALDKARAGSAPKPLMKPFTALIVELQHRKQRAELAAALASAGVTVEGTQEPTPGDAPEQAVPTAEAVAAVAGAAGADGTAANAPAAAGKSARRGRKRKSDMKTKKDGSANATGAQALPPTAAENAESLVVTRERAVQAAAAQNAARPAQPGAVVVAPPSAAKSGAAGAPAQALGQAGASAVAQTLRAAQAGAPVVAADARGNWPSIAQSAGAPGVMAVSPPSKAKPLTVAPAPHPGREAESVWEPLRSVGDVNEIHAGGAALIALLTFAIGVWIGRRRARAGRVGQPELHASDAQPVAELTPAPSADSAPSQSFGDEPVRAEAASAEPMAADEWSFEADPQPAAAYGNLLAQDAAALSQVHVPAPSAANDTAESRQTAAAADERQFEPGARKQAARREGAPGSAYTTRGGVQEELVVRRRPDRRGD